MVGPVSSYSCFVTTIWEKVDNEASIEPPIHTEYFLSGGDTIWGFMVGGINFFIPSFSLSSIPEARIANFITTHTINSHVLVFLKQYINSYEIVIQ